VLVPSGVILLLSGVQLLILGILGEYIGRLFLTANRKPQAVVGEVIRSKSALRLEALTGTEPAPWKSSAIGGAGRTLGQHLEESCCGPLRQESFGPHVKAVSRALAHNVRDWDKLMVADRPA
jgi:hypothetical protein